MANHSEFKTSRAAPDRIHSDDMSSLSQLFPVDIRDPLISEYVTETIPNAASNALFMQGCSSTLTTHPVPLFPLMAALRSENSGDDQKKIAREANFICDSLMEGRKLSYAHLNVSLEDSQANGFSMALTGDDRNTVYTIEGLLSPDIDKEQIGSGSFYLSRLRNGLRQEDELELDGSHVSSLLTAILLRHSSSVEIASNIETKLLQLLEISSTIESEEEGFYDMSPRYPALGLNAQLSRRTRKERQSNINSGTSGTNAPREAVSTQGYSIIVQEEALIPRHDNESLRAVNALSLDYERSGLPRYIAKFSTQVFDPERTMTFIDRDEYFDAMSNIYRSNPREFFITLGSIAGRLAELG